MHVALGGLTSQRPSMATPYYPPLPDLADALVDQDVESRQLGQDLFEELGCHEDFDCGRAFIFCFFAGGIHG